MRARYRPALLGLVLLLVLPGCIGRVSLGGGDEVHNYDYDLGGFAARFSAYQPDKRDMPVNFIFYGPDLTSARLGAVLNAAGGDTGAGSMYMPIKDGAHWQQDASGGTKDTLGPACSSGPLGVVRHYSYLHMRWYANPDRGYSSNDRFGHYIVGTSHFDHREGCRDEYFGYSEDAEIIWINRLQCVRGLSITRESVFLGNAEDTPRDAKHYMLSSGWATKVYIPAGLVPKNVC